MTSITDVSTFAASYGQQRLWFLCQLDPDADRAYHLGSTVRVRGPLDVEALRAALDSLVARHEPLRTRFRLVDPSEMIIGDQLVQEVLPDGRVGFTATDLTGASDAEVESALAAERDRPFDLEQGPLLRAHLVTRGPDEHILSLTAHHIIGDGWSMAIIGRELSARYRGDDLPDLGIQYADFAEWQRADTDTARAVDFWADRLAGLPALDLPTDRPRPMRQSFDGRRLDVTLTAELSAAVTRLARAHGATEFMVLLAAWQAVLGRIAGQTDFGVGTPVAGRPRPELESLVGFFVNTVVLRADLTGDPDFGTLLGRVRADVLDAFAHQSAPYEKVVERLAPERDLSRPPLFQVALSYQNTPPAALELAGAETEAVPAATSASAFDLNLALRPAGDRIIGHLDYSAALFDEDTAADLAGYFTRFLAAAVGAPDQPIADLVTSSPADARRLAGLDGGPGPTGDATVPARIRDVADARPDAVAVRAGDTVTTYRDLLERAARVSEWLAAGGVAPGGVVAVSLPPGPDLVAALLGVWGAGAVYLPVDPAFPDQRRAYMAADAGAHVTVTEAALADLPADAGPIAAPAPDDVAYLMYTSGSTGRPKGIAITHRSLSAFIDTAIEATGLTPADTCALLTTVSFDVAGYEIFAPLVLGGTVAVVAHCDLLDATALAAALARLAPQMAQATPTVWRSLADTGWSAPPGLRMVTVGEPLTDDLARALTASGARLFNAYGPTETTIWSTMSEVDGGPVTLGRPLPGEWVDVLDGHGRPVPAGAAGELYIGGHGVAVGYHGRGGLTAARFVPDPRRPGARRYRTGDLVRLDRDGDLRYLGRTDDQVKLRGQRIEPAEIESVLREHPAVRAAAVRVQGRGDRAILAAHVVPADPHAPPAVAALRAHAAGRLPSAMVPGAYAVTAALPHTPNGKLDRSALPVLDGGAEPGDAGPVTPLQARLLDIWRELLGRSDFGVRDHFFHVGGHSMLAARLVADIRASLGARLSVGQVFALGTVEQLAAALAAPAQPEGLARARAIDDDLAAMWADETAGETR